MPPIAARFLALTWNWTLHFNMNGGLKALPVDLGIPARPVAAVKLKNRTVSPVVELFIKHALELAKSMTSTRSPRRAKTAEPRFSVGCGSEASRPASNVRMTRASQPSEALLQ